MARKRRRRQRGMIPARRFEPPTPFIVKDLPEDVWPYLRFILVRLLAGRVYR